MQVEALLEVIYTKIILYSLGYLNSKKRLSESETRNIFKQVLNAVNFCHNKGIIHRDIKFENIAFIDEEKTTVKV